LNNKSILATTKKYQNNKKQKVSETNQVLQIQNMQPKLELIYPHMLHHIAYQSAV